MRTETKIENTEFGEEVMLSHRERREMLNLISQTAVLLFRASQARTEPESLAVGDFSAADASPFERVERLVCLYQRAMPLFLTLQHSPECRLEVGRRPVSLARSRGGGETLAQISSSVRAVQTLNGTGKAMLSPTLYEKKPLRTPDAPVQRTALGVMTRLTEAAKTLNALARFCGETEVALKTEPIFRSLEALRQSAQQAWEISPEIVSGVNVRQEIARFLPDSPLSAQLFGLSRELENPHGFDWNPPGLILLPLRPLWEIYELYCFAALVRSFLQAGFRLVSGDPLGVSEAGFYWKRTRGEESRLVFERTVEGETSRIGLVHQPLYAAASGKLSKTSSDRIVSRSHALRPDFVLETEGGIFVLDAKFRTYPMPESGVRRECNALQDDINKMHTYRDALQKNGQPATLGAYCLFPGTNSESNAKRQNLIAYPAATRENPLGTAGVGAIRLRPGNPRTEANLPLLFSIHR